MNQKLVTLANDLVAHSNDQESEQFNSFAQEFLAIADKCSTRDLSSVLSILSAAIESDNFEHAALTANICGSFIERGASPAEIQKALFEIVGFALSKCRQHLAKFLAQADAEFDLQEAFQDFMEKEFESAPGDAMAWTVVESFYLPTIAVLSFSPEYRKAASHFLEDALQISEFSGGAHWIARILQVLDQEPFIAIEPDTAIGIIGTMTGISGNFQLNELLMATFPQKGMFPRRRVSKLVEETARGNGPQQPGEGVTGHWNLCTWKALDKNGRLPDGLDAANWIWNEGVPADIPVFDGHRVILLGKASYSRNWASCRDFSKLKADLTIARRLDAKEVDAWLKKFAAASA